MVAVQRAEVRDDEPPVGSHGQVGQEGAPRRQGDGHSGRYGDWQADPANGLSNLYDASSEAIWTQFGHERVRIGRTEAYGIDSDRNKVLITGVSADGL